MTSLMVNSDHTATITILSSAWHNTNAVLRILEQRGGKPLPLNLVHLARTYFPEDNWQKKATLQRYSAKQDMSRYRESSSTPS